MSGVVCAIRGGPRSKMTIDRAVRLSEAKREPLYFLYVVNLDFLARSGYGRILSITEEMEEMGEFILLDAKEKAAQQGIAPEGVVLQGDVEQETIRLCLQVSAH